MTYDSLTTNGLPRGHGFDACQSIWKYSEFLAERTAQE
jgi:hypothetical protein